MTKQKLNWPALDAVPHHVVADSTWNNNIETFTPNQLLRMWSGIDVTKWYFMLIILILMIILSFTIQMTLL